MSAKHDVPLPYVAIVGVAYNSPSCSARFIAQVDRLTPSGGHLFVVVENGEQSAQPRTQQPPFHLRAPYNLGYFGGAAYAIRFLESAGYRPEWYVVSNVDVVISTSNLATLLREVPSAVGVVAPSVMGDDQVDANPFKTARPSLRRLLLLELAFRSSRLNRALRLGRTLRALARDWRHGDAKSRAMSTPGDRTIYAPHGSVVCVRRELVIATDFFRNAPFLYSEELFLAEEARRLGRTVQYLPTIGARHVGGVSTSRMDRASRLAAERSAMRQVRRRYWHASATRGRRGSLE